MEPHVRDEFIPKYESIFNFMNEDVDGNVDEYRIAFKELTCKLDKGREEDFTEVYPELSDWFKSIEADENGVWKKIL